ncbi:MAG: hypothetical protein WCC69_14560 [Pirellulales bacterium]
MAEQSPTASVRFQPWHDLRWITGCVVAIGLGWLAWNLFGPEPPIRVSRETTFITEPLAADGLPDYLAAVLAVIGPAPPAEENAAAGLLQTLWPLGIAGGDQPAVCKALGIPNEPPAQPLREPTRDAAAGITDDVYAASYAGPWTAEDFPALDSWMQAHATAIDRLVAAADRPRYWLPSPTLLKTGPQMLVGMLLPDIQEVRVASRLLVSRAMWHLGGNRPAEAWRDIRAAYRLSRLLAAPESGPTWLVTQLVAIATGAMADAAALQLLALPVLPADLLAEIRRDLDALAALPAPAAGAAFERLMGVDAIVWMARRQPGGRSARANALTMYGSGPGVSPLAGLALTSLDWNVMLERMNTAYDDLDAACGLPTHAARRTALERQRQQVIDRAAAPWRSWWTAAGNMLLLASNRGQRSAAVGDLFQAMLLPALSSWSDAVARGPAQFDLTRTAAALAAWRADREAGSPEYPERLHDLVPRYLAAVPIDPFSEKPFLYERRSDGYLMYSVGSNGIDDGGDHFSGEIINGEWQEARQEIDPRNSDIVVRMPIPRRPVKP